MTPKSGVMFLKNSPLCRGHVSENGVGNVSEKHALKWGHDPDKSHYFRVTWRSVRRIIQRVVAEQRDERRELDGLRVIGMDEISYRKRHKYLTVVIDHLSGRVVWAGKERKAKTLLRFFRKLGPQRAAELEAVSMDMWEPYITVVGKKAPQARVIFDRFHIVKHLNEAVDKTRRELVRELKGTARRNLKNTKFPLLKAKHNRSAKDKRVLREQVRANRRLCRAMLLRDDFMDLYTYKTETWAKKFLRGWLRRAMSSRIEPVKRAAKMTPATSMASSRGSRGDSATADSKE